MNRFMTAADWAQVERSYRLAAARSRAHAASFHAAMFRRFRIGAARRVLLRARPK